MFKIIKVGEQGGSIKIKWENKHYKTKLVPSIRRQKKKKLHTREGICNNHSVTQHTANGTGLMRLKDL